MKPRSRSFLPVLAVAVAMTAARAEASVSVLSGLTEERSAGPGESYTGEVRVANHSDRAAQIKIYQTDYRFDATGAAEYERIGSVARSNGPWVTVGSPGVLTLAAHEQTTIPYRVTVPAADLTGTYWSVLMLEEVPPVVLQADDPAEPSLGVRSVLRYAVQLVTHIGDTGAEDFRVAAMLLEARDADHLGLLHVELENIGERLLRAELRFELFDGEGRAAGVFLSGKKRLYPTTSGRFTVDLSTVPARRYQVLMLVRMASGSVYASEYQIEPAT